MSSVEKHRALSKRSQPMRTHKSSALPGPVILRQEESVESIPGKEDELWGEMKDDMKILIHSSSSGFVAGGKR